MDALVENASNTSTRFYCHSCSMEIDRVSTDFTCPHCMQGFIEELPAADRGSNNPPSPPPVADMESHILNPLGIRLASEIFSNSILSPLLLTTHGPRRSDSDGSLSLIDESADSSASGGGNGGGAHGTSIRARPRNRRRGVQNISNLDNILREILISVADGANGGAGGTPMFFMGNPGDYAWGREGLDTIVTQLLNQMDNTGPPPLEKDKIAEIPKVTISAEQVELKLQCSVCWEDFQIDEVVRKLSCAHVYHESCIIPWLQLHGTCPICRKSLAPEQPPDEQRGLAAAANAVANTLRSLQSDAFPGVSSQSSTSSIEEGGGPSTSSLLGDLGLAFGTGNPSRQRTSGAAASSSLSTNPGLGMTSSSSNNSSSRASQNSTSTSAGTSSDANTGANDSNSGHRYRDDDGNIDYEFD
ncbi:E3 ubiquitin-protein ligase Iruka-like [Uranotaenia lowii]|uniref:E3 ubiquitin-protein ligase Iruka-like n=1 Tax=Uranotaenia lowii TaxID=190385 RepID=UPI00247919EB|nr:E3 ubiquitin-protein ligase Iruka-like [Uranotaenia lowii]